MKTGFLKHRLLETVPALLSYLVLILPLILAFRHPVWVAVFIICFDLYWLFKSLYFSTHIVRSYARLRRSKRIKWDEKLKLLNDNQAKKIHHLVLLCINKEDPEIADACFAALARSKFDCRHQMSVVFSLEERGLGITKPAIDIIKKKYSNKFRHLLITVHPKDLPGEVKGKGPNLNWAMKVFQKDILSKLKADPKDILVTVYDIDGIIHSQYFACLTYTYLTDDRAAHHSYQPIPFYFNNLWDTPSMMRVVAMGSSYWQMIESSRNLDLRIFSAYSVSYHILKKADFWSYTTPVEDGMQYWRNYVAMNGDYEVIPIYLTVNMDAVLDKNYWSTYYAQYKQLRRWATGASDITFIVPHFWGNKKIPWYKRFVRFWRFMDSHISWSTAPLTILLVGWYPLIVNPNFGHTVLGANLGKTTSTILTVALVGIFISMILNVLLLPRKQKKISYSVWSVLQWVFLPLITIFYGALPALDAQTRLALGKIIKFEGTDKVRKKK